MAILDVLASNAWYSAAKACISVPCRIVDLGEVLDRCVEGSPLVLVAVLSGKRLGLQPLFAQPSHHKGHAAMSDEHAFSPCRGNRLL